MILEISDDLLSDLAVHGLADRVDLFDYILNENGISLLEKLCCPDPPDSRLQLHDFTAAGTDSIDASGERP